MVITTVLVCGYFFVDLYFNYIKQDFYADSTPENDPVPNTMIAEYYFVGVMYLLLTVMLVWLTLKITKNLKGMGQLL